MNTSNKYLQQSRGSTNNQQNGSFDYEDGDQEDNHLGQFKSPTKGNQMYYERQEGNENQTNYRQINGKQGIKTRLKIIFTFYCSYGDRTNTTILKSNKFRKLMIESKMLDDRINQKYVDLLYTQYTQNKVAMDFNNFCNILARISSEKYKQLHPSQALLKVIDEHFGEIYEFIMVETELGKDLQLFDIPIDKDCIVAAKSLYPIFKRIYLAYFSWEPTNSLKLSENFKQSLNGLFNFLKDFDIFPNLMTKSTSFLLYDQLVESSSNSILNNNLGINTKAITPFGHEDIGKIFTLNRFITFTIKASQICFSKVPEAQQFQMKHPIQKFIALLERMELSEGFLSFEKKIHSTHNSSISLLIPFEAIQEVNSQIFESQNNHHILTLTQKQILSQNRDLAPNQLGFQHSMNTPKKDIKIRFNDSNEKWNHTQNKISPGSQYEEPMSKSPLSKQNRKMHLLQSLDIDDRALEVFERYQNELQYIFITFCQYGEPCNTQFLKTIKLTKLLKNAGLMRKRDPIANNNQQRQSSPQRPSRRDGKKYLDQTFLDCLIARLVGPNQVRQFTNKMTEYDRQITSPNIGFLSYQSNKTDNHGSKGKLEYEHFLKILQEISIEFYPDLDIYDSLNTIIADHILKAQIEDDRQPNRKISDNYIALHNAITEDQDILSLLEDIHPSLNSYFRKYSYPRETKMSLDQFLQFCKDFDVFPNLMPKSQLHYIFTALSFIYKQQNGQNESKQLSMYQKGEEDNLDFINSQLFTEAIGICAIEVYTIEQSYINRILLLLERMNSSNGPKIMLKSLGLTSAKTTQWDLLGDVRKKYQPFYEEKMMNRNRTYGRLNTDQDENNFEKLLDQGFQNYLQNNNDNY